MKRHTYDIFMEGLAPGGVTIKRITSFNRVKALNRMVKKYPEATIVKVCIPEGANIFGGTVLAQWKK